jgi:N-acetylglucosaminyldiphosphoundecaprenol N-acetyl-beta-D-mannosaminyltransferase
MLPAVEVLGLPLARADYAVAVAAILDAARAADRPRAVSAANTHVVALARHDPTFRAALARFDLHCPDGMPLVWAMNRKLPAAERLADRVYGPTLMLRTFEESARAPGFRHFLLGGKPSTLEKLAATLPARFPGTTLAGTYSPPFGAWPEDEFDRIAQKIRDARANLVWVGLGCPKQERWIAEHKDRLPPAVYLAVGAAFAFHAGEVRQAPAWIQRRGLEWLFRLCAEPRRLFKRYFTYNSLFLFYLALEALAPGRRR